MCRSATWLTGGYTAAVVGGVALAGALHTVTAAGVNIACGIALGAVVFGAAAAASFTTRSDPGMSMKQWFDVWIFAGTRNLRRTFQVCVSTHKFPLEPLMDHATLSEPTRGGLGRSTHSMLSIRSFLIPFVIGYCIGCMRLGFVTVTCTL